MDSTELLFSLKKEVKELEKEIFNPVTTFGDIRMEAVDVANYAMMIYDNNYLGQYLPEPPQKGS